MVRDAYRFLLPLVGLSAILLIAGLTAAAAVTLVLAGFVAFFFRNPKRDLPPGEKLVLSPADGKIVRIAPCPACSECPEGTSISIFLSVFDVHVNRSPVRGRLEKLEYRRGRFKAAFDDEASLVNEQNVLSIATSSGVVVVRQIAGIVARRVICWKREGDPLERGEVFGLIRFGSRVDILIPAGALLKVKVGDRVSGGSSILAEYP